MGHPVVVDIFQLNDTKYIDLKMYILYDFIIFILHIFEYILQIFFPKTIESGIYFKFVFMDAK